MATTNIKARNSLLKHLIAWLFFATVAQALLAQSSISPSVENDTRPLLIAEKRPLFFDEAGQSLEVFLEAKKVYPETLRDAGIGGTVPLKFVVNEDGSLGAVRLVRMLHPELNAAAIATLRTTEGKWKPGEQNGKPVKVFATAVVVFSATTAKDKSTPTPKFYSPISNADAYLRYQAGDYKEALPILEKTALEEPENKTLANYIAWCHYFLEDKEKACATWEAAKKLDKFFFNEMLKKYCN